MNNICKNVIKTNLINYILKDLSLLYLLNKQELHDFFHALIKEEACKIKFIDNPTKEMQFKAIEKNSWIIQFIKNPTEKVQLRVVKQNGIAIYFINNPTEQGQLDVLKNQLMK